MVETELLMRFARDAITDPNVPDYVKRAAEWYLNGQITDDTFFNAVSYYANIDVIQSDIGLQQQIQLTAIGESITGGAEKDIEQDSSIAALWDSIQNSFAFSTEIQDQLNAVNERLSSQVVDLGSKGGGCDIFCQLGIGLGGVGIGSLAVLGLGAVILLRT